MYLYLVGPEVEEFEVEKGAEGGHGNGGQEIVGQIQFNKVHQTYRKKGQDYTKGKDCKYKLNILHMIYTLLIS
jgi:hypothetical protein